MLVRRSSSSYGTEVKFDGLFRRVQIVIFGSLFGTLKTIVMDAVSE